MGVPERKAQGAGEGKPVEFLPQSDQEIGLYVDGGTETHVRPGPDAVLEDSDPGSADAGDAHGGIPQKECRGVTIQHGVHLPVGGPEGHLVTQAAGECQDDQPEAEEAHDGRADLYPDVVQRASGQFVDQVRAPCCGGLACADPDDVEQEGPGRSPDEQGGQCGGYPACGPPAPDGRPWAGRRLLLQLPHRAGGDLVGPGELLRIGRGVLVPFHAGTPSRCACGPVHCTRRSSRPPEGTRCSMARVTSVTRIPVKWATRSLT